MTPPQAPENNITAPPADKVSVKQMLDAGKDWFRFFLRKWWIILLAGVAGGLYGIWTAYKDVPTYESRLTFALDDSGGDLGGVSSIAAQFGINIGGGGGRSFFSGDNILEILKSRRILKTVLLSADTINGKYARLIQHYIELGRKDPTAKLLANFPLTTPPNQFSYRQDSVLLMVVNAFADKLVQADRPDRKLDIYEVKVTTRSERLSKVLTDRIVQETINFYTQLRVKKSKETLDILEERVASMKGNLNSSIAAKASTQDANVNPAFAAAQVPQQKQAVNIQVYGGAYAELFKNLELARFQYLKEIPLLQVIDAADYPMKKIKMGKLMTGIKYGAILTFLTVIGLVVFRYTKGSN